MRWIVLLCGTGWLVAAEPVRYTAPKDGLLHVSVHRAYSELPADVTVTGLNELRSYTPENTQTHPGQRAFRAGLVRRGQTYEISTSAPGDLNYELLEPPNGADPERAVAAGMSWLIRAADSWLQNQPRHGAIERAGQRQHPEARACIACHITQFTTRAYLTAMKNGYPVHDAPALAAVTARLRENPRPLYGHAGVNWARVIYSARTVSSRLPLLWSAHREATGQHVEADRDLILGAARFLLLSDECQQLRPEADGARPEVSGFEIAWQSWRTFQLAARLEPANPVWPRQTACVANLLTTASPANTIDAAWRLIALAELGRPTAGAITQLLALQQADGRFALTLEAKAPAADFVSYHVLYALAVAGHRGPAVERLAKTLLAAQRPDGSWKGAPVDKGFDTPFRETQFAVMALSELYRRRPATVTPPIQLSSRPDVWRSASRDAEQRRLLARLAEDPAAVEAFAASLDENLGMLREWQRAIRQPAEAARVEAGLRADSQRQATLLADALRQGSRTVRLRVLQAMATVVSVEGFPARPRVGNDMEAPQLLADDGQKLEKAILACVDGRDPELTAAALRAGTALSDVLSPDFALALLELPVDQSPVLREAYGPGGRGRLTLSRDGRYPAAMPAVLTRLLTARDPQALALVLPLLASLEPGDSLTRDIDLQGAMDSLLRAQPTAEVVKAAAVFPRLADGPLMRTQVLAAMASPDPALRQAAVEVVVERYIVNPNLAAMTGQFLGNARGPAQRLLLDSLDPSRVAFRLDLVNAYSPPRFEVPADANILGLEFVQEFVRVSLLSHDPQVQAAALDLTRKHARLHSLPAIQSALVRVNESPSARTRLVTRALLDKREPTLEPEALLDFAYFRERIQPILERPAADGRSCIMCHASNARFPLKPEARANYQSVARKVTLADPTESPVLRKPLLPGVTSDGDVFRTSHNGGERWPGRTGSPEYQTILEWIRGGQLPVASAGGQ